MYCGYPSNLNGHLLVTWNEEASHKSSLTGIIHATRMKHEDLLFLDIHKDPSWKFDQCYNEGTKCH